MRDSSFGFGDNNGMSVTTVGNGNRAPTIEVASVRGTPNGGREEKNNDRESSFYLNVNVSYP